MTRFAIVLGLCAIILTLPAPAHADPGSDAYNRGDYGKAIEAWRKEAYSNPQFAYNLGYMYETGQGTTPDPQEAFKWYEEAARDARGDGYKELKRDAVHALVRIVITTKNPKRIATASKYISTHAMKTGNPLSLRYRGLLMEFQADDSIARKIRNAQNPMEAAYGYLRVAAERGSTAAKAEASRVFKKVKDKQAAKRAVKRTRKELKRNGVK
ncbi:hypothetical protein V5T82_03915 [Magnetovibrio sp. PR-2]|uniref:SEL1-like repeat protein n=1 Tax=Magnetovibrio sp. PR-2 TaxID=3120356 RepID=UPI002FCE2B9B